MPLAPTPPPELKRLKWIVLLLSAGIVLTWVIFWYAGFFQKIGIIPTIAIIGGDVLVVGGVIFLMRRTFPKS